MAKMQEADSAAPPLFFAVPSVMPNRAVLLKPELSHRPFSVQRDPDTMSHLRRVIDDDADEIARLSATIELLLHDNELLRRENAILRTPTGVYETAFLTGSCAPSIPQDSSGILTACTSSTDETPMRAAEKYIAAQRCSARIRATEQSIIDAGAEAATWRARCHTLEERVATYVRKEEASDASLAELVQQAREKDNVIRELAARCDAKDLAFRNVMESRSCAAQIADELEHVVHGLREALMVESEKCFVLQADVDRLRGAEQAVADLQTRIDVAKEELATLNQDYQTLRRQYDNSRVRIVELEQQLELQTTCGALVGKNS